MRVKAYMAAYFLAQAVYQSYISLFYRARGLDAACLGALCALSAAASIPGQLLFGAAADRARVPGRVLRAPAAFGGSAARFADLRPQPLRPVCAGGPVRLCLYAGAAHRRRPRAGTPFARRQALRTRAADGRAGLRCLGARLRLFPRRLWAGELVALSAAALMLFALFASFLLGGEKRPREKVRPLRLLKNRRLLCLLLFVLPAQATMGYFYAFFPTRFLELPGATGALLGWANLISALAEVPFLLVGDRVFRRWARRERWPPLRWRWARAGF